MGGPANFGTSASMGAGNFARNSHFGPGGPIMSVGAHFGCALRFCACELTIRVIFLLCWWCIDTQATTIIVT
jgi:hypothetical protein